MTLAAGSRLGPYEILAPLGAGGMGEVYRARDTRLSRDVAVKVLPSDLTPTAEARQRFEREARTISQLSHPNVCALYDVGREGSTEFLVMELLEGDTLSERLAAGPLPLAQALRFGAEIAAALEAAHRKGIVHRDLKPANVMVTPAGVKLLDFGLARAFEAPVAIGGLSAAPTVGKDLTAEGVIVGTVAYMAPEQLEGKEADARTDIFSFGAVLYEMLTGRRAFAGTSPATLISSILTADPPPVSAASPLSPPELDRLVRTCLAKAPADRWQSTHDLELQLRSMGSGSMPTAALAARRGRRFSWLPWAAAAACAGLAAVSLLRGGGPKRSHPPTVRFSVPPPEGGAFGYVVEGNFMAVSPDGSQIAYVAWGAKDTAPRVWLRPLSAPEARPISGTEDASSIFWSPDGRSIAFFTNDKLKRVDVAGGAAVPICDIPSGSGKAGTWGRSDILFTTIQGGALYRVPVSGGQPVVQIRADAERVYRRLGWPWFLPDGERFLYLVRDRDGRGDLMLSEPGKPPRAVTHIESFFQYVDPGFLVYSQEGTLVAQRFDLRSGRASGEPVSVAERVRYFYSTASAAFAARAGTIAYLSRTDSRRLVWFDRSGREVATVGPPGDYLDINLTADGKRLLFSRTRPGLETFHVWTYDLERGVEAPVTNGLDTEAFPRLLGDGKTLIYSAVLGTPPLLRRRDLATGREVPLTEGRQAFQKAEDVSPDGRTLLFTERTETGNSDIWALVLDGAAKPVPILQSPFEKREVRFSPDGRFVAFVSGESGRPEAYVMPFPGPGERVRVSDGGAELIRWGRDGELYYVSGDNRFVAVPVRTSPGLQVGTPTTLFKVASRPWINFDISPDMQRILAIVSEVEGNESPLNVVLNWPGEAAP
ncbi:MAG TPA: protein kinase [Thermoanaerobaculia bacterium]|jgi:Tol biopolymer transport system component|nr:protein kinase [Thermoanaerobaculia bacterium]